MDIDLTTKEVTDAIDAAVKKATDSAKEATAGLEASRDKLLSEKKNLRDELKKFEGLDADKMREMMTNINRSAETKLIADGKLEEVWELRSKAMQGHFDTELSTRDTKITSLTENNNALNLRLTDLSIGTVLRDAATKNKLLPTAVDDALLQGRALFSMQKNGSLAIVDNNGFVQPGPDGKTPLQPEEWLQGLKETKPHWWAQSSGAGATGGAGSPGSGATINRNRFDTMSQIERSKFIDGGGKIL